MDDLLAGIEKLGRREVYAKDEYLFHAGDEARGFYYVSSGSLRIFRMDEKGREAEVVRLHPGEFFGEAIVFVADTFPAYAQVLKKTEVLFFPKREIFARIGRDPKVARLFIRLLAQKCVVLNKRLETLELKTVRQRLAQFFLDQSRKQGSDEIVLGMKKIELAKFVGTISETLSRNLRTMREDHLIRVQGRVVRLLDPARLKEELLD